MRRVVRALLWLFPARFRQEFGGDMLATFDDRWREQRGWRLALRTVFDLLTSAAMERPKGDGAMTILWQDLRFAARTLLRTPGFTAVALATLALGIGVNTAMFGVAHAVLWRSLPYPHAERLVIAGEVDAKKPDSFWGTSYLSFLDWKTRSHAFERLAAVMNTNLVLREKAEPVRISGAAVTHDFFDVMGVAPVLGRVFGEVEDRKGAPGVVVLSHKLWTTHLGGDPAIVGRAIRIGTASYTVMGVMPASFAYRGAEFWMPLEEEIDPYFRARRSVWVLDAVGRLNAGSTPADAQREVEAIARQIRREFPETNRGLAVRVNPLRDQLSLDLRPALMVLMGAVGLVLLIACANLAGLMLVRATGRAREMAIRSALGVSGGRLIRQMLTESALLACVGGAAGIALAVQASRGIALLTKDPRLLDVPMDASVLAFAAGATLLTTILFGIGPAIRATRVDAGDALKSGGRTHGSAARSRTQRVLVVAEVALCVALLAGAGLLFKSFRRVLQVAPGFRTENLMTMRLRLPPSYRTVAEVRQFYTRAADRMAGVPGVRGATLVSRLPISGGESNGDINIEGRPAVSGELGISTFRRVLPNYFAVMGIPLVRGRVFDDRDDGSRGRVTIINEGFARRFWPGGDPIGKRIKIGPADAGAWLTIVGVVGDVRQIGLDAEPPYSTYEPLMILPANQVEVAMRASGEASSVIAGARRELRALEAELLVDQESTMEQRISDSVSPRRLNLVLFGMFAGLALVLASLGLYGVVAYAAGQRTQEFGIRVALGAQTGDVLRLVLGQGIRLAAAGVAIGLAATLILGRMLTTLLFGVQPTDPLTLAAVAVVMTAVAIAACWVPAHRATRVAPVDALRSE
jgi:putative ABC transport system permease protein